MVPATGVTIARSLLLLKGGDRLAAAQMLRAADGLRYFEEVRSNLFHG